jgi:hypothetical protein
VVTITSITANATSKGNWFAKNTQTSLPHAKKMLCEEGHENRHVSKKKKKKKKKVCWPCLPRPLRILCLDSL